MDIARRSRGSFLLLASAFALLPAMAGLASAQEAADDVPVVNVVTLRGGIDAAYADYIVGEIEGSERRGDLAVVFQMSGSGAVKVDTADLVAAVADADVPVAAWVGPVELGTSEAVSGAHTAVWLAAASRFVANGAQVRSMVPLQPGGGTGGLVRVLDALGADGSEPALAGLVERGGSLSDTEVLRRGLATPVPRTGDGAGRITEGSVNSIRDVIRALDGTTFDLPRGPRTIAGADEQEFTIRNANPGLLTKVRQALATNPTLVYLLLLVGAGALVFGFFQPGFGPAGYTGVLLLALSAYGLVALPTNPVGLALALLGLAALAVDVGRGGLGVLTWGGTAALAAGSALLVHSDGPALRVPWAWIVVGVLGSWVFYVVVMTVVLRALRGQSAALGQALLGRTGEVRSTLNPQGHVLVEGALWRAQALEWDGPVGAGTRVTVTGVDEAALILDVEPVPDRG